LFVILERCDFGLNTACAEVVIGFPLGVEVVTVRESPGLVILPVRDPLILTPPSKGDGVRRGHLVAGIGRRFQDEIGSDGAIIHMEDQTTPLALVQILPSTVQRRLK
jgi:hypothetical protein